MVQDGTLDVSPITANGAACDSLSTVTSLTINGQAVPLTGTPPCLDFSTQIDSRWGLNVITGTARNQAGATTTLAQSYLRSPQYSTVTSKAKSPARAAATSESVPGGVYMQLGQTLADDNNRNDVDDIATLIERNLSTIDLNAVMPTELVPSPGTSHCDCVWPLNPIDTYNTGYSVNRGTLATGGWHINYVRLGSSGISMSLSLNGPISMPVSVRGYLNLSCAVACVDRSPGITALTTGTVSADQITVDGTIDVAVGADGRPNVIVCGSCLNVHALNPALDIDWGALEFLDGPLGLSNITTSIINLFQTQIENMIASQIQNVLPPLVAQLLESFEPPVTVTLPPPMNTVLNVESSFDTIDIGGFYPNGYARLGLAMAVSPASPVVTSPLGSIRRGGSVPSFNTAQYDFGFGLKDDLLNQFLWAAWSGGAFELQDLSGTGCALPGGLAVRMSATLPPVVMPGTNGHQVDIGFGDVYIETGPPPGAAVAASMTPSGDVGLYASMMIGATVTIDPDTDKLILTPAADPVIDVQIVRAAASADRDALGAQYRDMLACLLPRLLTEVVAAVPTPSPPIGVLGLPGIALDARWGLSNGTVDRQDPYYTVAGNVVLKQAGAAPASR